VAPATGAPAVHPRIDAQDVEGADPLRGEGGRLDRGVLLTDRVAERAGPALAEGLPVQHRGDVRRHVDRVGADPDEFVRSYGPEAFRQLLAKSLNVVEFLIACATKRYNLRDPEEKADAAQLILPTIAKVPNAILRKEYVRLIANRLDLDEAAVLEELGKVKPRIAAPPTAPERRSPIQGAERLLTALLLDEPARWDAVKGEPLLEQISDARLRRILEVVCEMRAMNHSEPTPAKVISRLAGEELGGLVSELVELAHVTPSKDEALRECVKRLTVDARKRQLATLREQIRTAQQLGHEQELARLLANYQRFVKGGEGAWVPRSEKP